MNRWEQNLNDYIISELTLNLTLKLHLSLSVIASENEPWFLSIVLKQA